MVKLTSWELDQRTKLQIFGKRRHSEIYTKRIGCPTCPVRPPNGLHGDMITLQQWAIRVSESMIRIPQREEPDAIYCCSVCEEIIRMQELADDTLNDY